MCVTSGNKEKAIMTDDAQRRALKALAAPKSGAVVPANRSGRDLIAAGARAAAAGRTAPNDDTKKVTALVDRINQAAARPVSSSASPKAEAAAEVRAPAEESKGALLVRIKESAARPSPIRPVVKAPEPAPIVEAPAAAPAPVPAVVPATAPAVPSPAGQIVPVEIAPGQTVPVEVPPNAGNGQPIVVNVNVVNEQRGPYWPYGYGPYWGPYAGCRAANCPRWHGWSCTGLFCRW
jgi:hypothetical protein